MYSSGSNHIIEKFDRLSFQISLLYLKFQDDQPDVQGLAVLLSSERYATNSPIGMCHKHNDAFHTAGLSW